MRHKLLLLALLAAAAALPAALAIRSADRTKGPIDENKAYPMGTRCTYMWECTENLICRYWEKGEVTGAWPNWWPRKVDLSKPKPEQPPTCACNVGVRG